ncbi:MAG: DUF3047 domain-containing protein [Rubrivivax sp.]|nr:DUF3047 domain-containing protein [Rubrivivax sp.]
MRPRALGAAALLLPAAVAATVLAPLQLGGDWRVVGLPKQRFPLTRFAIAMVDGAPALRIDAEGSYGNLVHAVPGGEGRTLRWRWRVDRPQAGADLRRKEADDTALKVCALFRLPLEALPFWERQKMRLARSVSGEDLPAATLCYVWDAMLPAGTLLPNAYTPRLRWMVLQGAGAPLATWRGESRDLHADFLRAFGDEARDVPPLQAIAVGADGDNTDGSSQAFVADLVLER